MSFQIETAFVKQWNTTLFHNVQQKGSRLRPCVREEGLKGEESYYDSIGTTTAIEVQNRHGDSPLISTPHGRRKVTPTDFEWGDMVDNEDKLKMLIDPASAYAQSAVWAFGRKIDDLIINAGFGTAYTGKAGGTAVTLPASQVVPVGAASLTIAKLLNAKEILDAADVDPDEERYIALSAKQVTTLLNTTEVKSSDYNTVKALAEGKLDTFMGFKFIRTQRLPVDGSNYRRVLCWAKSGILLAMPKDITTKMAERSDKRFNMYVYACMSGGATRMEEEKVVEIPCTE